jgi:hypothetical protein
MELVFATVVSLWVLCILGMLRRPSARNLEEKEGRNVKDQRGRPHIPFTIETSALTPASVHRTSLTYVHSESEDGPMHLLRGIVKAPAVPAFSNIFLFCAPGESEDGRSLQQFLNLNAPPVPVPAPKVTVKEYDGDSSLDDLVYTLQRQPTAGAPHTLVVLYNCLSDRQQYKETNLSQLIFNGPQMSTTVIVVDRTLVEIPAKVASQFDYAFAFRDRDEDSVRHIWRQWYRDDLKYGDFEDLYTGTCMKHNCLVLCNTSRCNHKAGMRIKHCDLSLF